MRYRYILILCVWIEATFASSKVFYVSSSKGNDSFSGESLKTPWKSIVFAIKKVVEISNQIDCDVELLIDSGDYDVNEEIVLNGKQGKNQLFIKAIKAGNVTLRGDYVIRGMSGKGVIKHVCLKGIDLGVAVGDDNRLDFYCNNRRQPLAGWPNGDNLYIKKPLGTTVLKSGNRKEPIFEYDNRQMNRFAKKKDIFAHGYWANEWRDEYMRVTRIDTVNNSVTMETDFIWGFKQGRPYRLLNLQSELDSVGEFFVNRQDSMLYWYSESYNSKKDALTLTRLNAKQMLSITNSENVVVDGICFVGGRNNCTLIYNCKNVELRNCRISRFGDSGVQVKNSWDIDIDGCSFESLGGWGVTINSGNKVNLRPGNVTVNNCIFKSLSNYRETYRQAIHVLGCGVLIAHNHFIDHPQSALRVDANDVVIEYNVFEDLVKKSYDQGAFDICSNFSFRGIVIRYNYWRNINEKRNVAAVRFDDKISGHSVYGNIFENCGNTYFGAVQIHGGNHNHIFHNVFVDCPAAVSFDRWKKERFIKALEEDSKDKNLGMFSTDVYKKRYPELNKAWDVDINKNYIHDNLIINAKEPYRRDGGESVITNNKVVTESTKLTRNIPKLLRKYNMGDIPYKKMGVQRNIYQ